MEGQKVFFGEYKHTLTKGNRLALPSKLRGAIAGSNVVFSRGFEKCIFGYEKEAWEKMARLELEKPISTEEGRRVRRQIFAGVLVAEIDQQGRFVLPQPLADYADITGAVFIIGAGDHFEIWGESAWKSYLERLGSDETRS